MARYKLMMGEGQPQIIEADAVRPGPTNGMIQFIRGEGDQAEVIAQTSARTAYIKLEK